MSMAAEQIRKEGIMRPIKTFTAILLVMLTAIVQAGQIGGRTNASGNLPAELVGTWHTGKVSATTISKATPAPIR